MRHALAALVVFGFAQPALAVEWGYDLHQGIQSVGMRNDEGALFAFVCGADLSGEPMLGVDLEVVGVASEGGPMRVDILDEPTGVVAPQSVAAFDVVADPGIDSVLLSAYDFSDDQAAELLDYLASARSFGVYVEALGATAIFEPTGGTELIADAATCD